MLTAATNEEIVFQPGQIHDVVVRDIKKFADSRGWLAEIFRHDELDAEFYPAMAYISATEPHTQRGPHEHVDQADLFGFLGTGDFKMRMWDNRPDSPTYRNMMTLNVGQSNPQIVIVPKGVVHAYKNISETVGIVINCPNRLYMGEGRRAPVDEIRHEEDPDTPYRMDN